MNESPEQPCPMSMQVQRLIDGELPEDQEHAVIEHLNQCEICSEMQRAFSSISSLLETVRSPDANWQEELTKSAPTIARSFDLRFVRRLTAVAAVLVAGLSAVAFTIPETTQNETSPYATIDKLTQSDTLGHTEFASSFARELGVNQ